MGVHPRAGVRSNEGAQLEKDRGITAAGRRIETDERVNDRPKRGIDNIGPNATRRRGDEVEKVKELRKAERSYR